MILEAKNISKEFKVEKGMFGSAGSTMALDRVSFTLREFTTLGIVGESGSGKTTLAKILLGLVPQSSGEVITNPEFIKNFRKDVQIIFQNPFNSLDPKMRIKNALYEPLAIHKICARHSLEDKAIELLKTVGLDETAMDRYPAQFSGGQRQRICIARALACEPRLLVLDEPISSLDLTIQAKLLDLFIQLKGRLNLTYIFISHNLSVIKYIADEVMVMQGGRVVERAAAQDLFAHPGQIYTRELLNAAR
ncbi:MAG: dipeptide/oligopeptide/nickel ABC transporter ATP-binding protein [Candidatus Omnitrophica bacterium]|jgi:ABC-type glutathione transport system ATPase component|nr:dipeptide/oligopeptide/nickel ABC transporter ATP-binding protein [Candidatus Omnitrophota bacterium]